MGLFKVYLGFHLGFCCFYHGLKKKHSRRAWGFMVDLGLRVSDLGFKI